MLEALAKAGGQLYRERDYQIELELDFPLEACPRPRGPLGWAARGQIRLLDDRPPYGKRSRGVEAVSQPLVAEIAAFQWRRAAGITSLSVFSHAFSRRSTESSSRIQRPARAGTVSCRAALMPCHPRRRRRRPSARTGGAAANACRLPSHGSPTTGHLLLRLTVHRNIGSGRWRSAGPTRERLMTLSGSGSQRGYSTTTITAGSADYFERGRPDPLAPRGAARFRSVTGRHGRGRTPGEGGFFLLDVYRVDGSGPTSRGYSSPPPSTAGRGSRCLSGSKASPRGGIVYVASRRPGGLVSDVVAGRYRIGTMSIPTTSCGRATRPTLPHVAVDSVTVPVYAGAQAVSATGPLSISLGPRRMEDPTRHVRDCVGPRTARSAAAGAPLPEPQVVYTPKRAWPLGHVHVRRPTLSMHSRAPPDRAVT